MTAVVLAISVAVAVASVRWMQRLVRWRDDRRRERRVRRIVERQARMDVNRGMGR